jgi:hypothetical protein
MPFLRIPLAGQYGVNKDLAVHDLPANAWTDALNVRFLDGYAIQFFGKASIYETVQNTPLHLFPLTIEEDRHWIYLGENSAYSVYKDTVSGTIIHTDLTTSISTTSPNQWTSAVLGGIPVINNGVDSPQRWDLNLANNFVDLDNWPANTTCSSLRVYKQFLIALGVVKNGEDYPFLVKWSHPADAGSVPESWDEEDPNYDTGEYPLSEGYDIIIDGMQLRDSFMIYKESSIWRMDLVGAPFIFSFKRVLGTSGALNRNCIVELDGYHFVLTGSDVIVHDGQKPRSVLDKKVRRFLFKDMDVESRANAFVFKNPFFNEAYVCYPQVGSSVPDKALVWNYLDDTITFTDIPNIYHASFGVDTNAITTSAWDDDDQAWNEDLTLWNDAETVPRRAKVLMASADPALYLLDATATDASGPGANYVEKRGLFFEEDERRVLIQSIRPRLFGNTGDTVVIKVGGTDDSPYNDPIWDAEVEFVIGEDVSADVLVDRRYAAFRVENGTALQWRMDSLDVEYVETGRW